MGLNSGVVLILGWS